MSSIRLQDTAGLLSFDHGFTSKHRYYYCGDQVTAEPEYLDDGLARFKYTFPDGREYTLNMFPLRKELCPAAYA